MTKVDFNKAEDAFDKALQKMFIDHLAKLVAAVDEVQNYQAAPSNQTMEEMIGRFQKELLKIKQEDPKLYEKLNLSPEEEQRFTLPAGTFSSEDWVHIRNLKLRIDQLKQELHAEYEKQVALERRRHVNKRHNIRDGWLPLR